MATTITGKGQIVQMTKSDGGAKYYFPRTTFDAVFNSEGADLATTIATVNAILNSKIGLDDKIEFTIIQPSDNEYSYPTFNSGETLNRILGKLQIWWNIINNKADGIPAGTQNVDINTEGVAANKALRDAADGRRFADKYALKEDVNKAVLVKGSVPTWRDLKDKSASQLSSLAPGYMYTVMETTPNEDSQWYYVYYPELDSEGNPVWRRYMADNDEGYERIEVKANDDFVFLGKPYSVIKYGTDGKPEVDENNNIKTIDWPDIDEHGLAVREDAYWQYVGGKIDTSSFALKSETPYVIEIKQVDYKITM